MYFFLEVPVVSAALCTCERIKILQSLFSIFISYQFVPAGSPQSASLRNNFYANVTYLALHFLWFFFAPASHTNKLHFPHPHLEFDRNVSFMCIMKVKLSAETNVV